MTSILESLLHAEAVGVEDALQQAGLESLELLGTGFATFRVQATEIVRRFIMSPALHPSDDPTTATPVLIAATRCYHALLGDKETGTAAAVQAILNQLSGFERGLTGGASSVDVNDLASLLNGDSSSQRETASNLVHAVSLLARETKSAAVRPPLVYPALLPQC